MIRSGLVLAASALALAACSSAPSTTDSAATPTVTQPVDEFALAMQTVNQLVDAGNTQTAIDRLTQLTGDPDLTREELADTLLRRGELRFSEQGYDLMGAISDFEEIINDLPDTEAVAAAVPMLDIARGKATSLNTLLAQPETTRQEKFNILMELGQHQEAMDLMIQSNLTPDNDTLVAMYQIGYLCEGDELTGREYDAIEPDGTQRTLRFCDFGK
ncbi:hypothetical protein HY29_05755 [Hyphomonas beringensis]|uniref:Lipoprotein n=1 Tax=Hyphomonas beringensis TaxID=1280946 RepID=A0A062U5E9_9PROT|nr:hypothetical protein [Hyphomonas beringensis]KCZ51370.1 hypothetical protein HY29_05755 [Hyphomonas beringensis]